MSEKRQAHRALVARILDGQGFASTSMRLAAFNNAVSVDPLRTLLRKVARQPTRITDSDINAVKASGVSEDQLFELVVCAAVGEATRQYETALAALAEACGQATPEEPCASAS